MLSSGTGAPGGNRWLTALGLAVQDEGQAPNRPHKDLVLALGPDV